MSDDTLLRDHRDYFHKMAGSHLPDERDRRDYLRKSAGMQTPQRRWKQEPESNNTDIRGGAVGGSVSKTTGACGFTCTAETGYDQSERQEELDDAYTKQKERQDKNTHLRLHLQNRLSLLSELQAEEKRLTEEWKHLQGKADWILTNTPQKVRVGLSGIVTTEEPTPEERQRLLEEVESELHDMSMQQTQQLHSTVNGATGGMILRGGKRLQGVEGQPQSQWLPPQDPYLESLCPLITKTQGQPHYVPWSFMDMHNLASRLPEITDGASKWIDTLEENTAVVTLALGDVKVLLMHVAGKHATEEVFATAEMEGVVKSHSRRRGFWRTSQQNMGCTEETVSRKDGSLKTE